MFAATTKKMEIPRSSWASFYRELANEANERAAKATTPSVKDKFEEVAREWSELSDWAERRNTV